MAEFNWRHSLRLRCNTRAAVQYPQEMKCVRARSSLHRILVHAVYQHGLRGDGGMRAGHLHPTAVGDAQAFTARPVDVE